MPFAEDSRLEQAAEGSRFGVTPGQPPGPRPSLHVLLLEDEAGDADLIVHELRRGYEPIARRVTSRAEMLEALNEGTWQIVLLDYSLEGGGTALQSLAALAEFDIDLPTILISGPIGEEEAADALRAGANDFVNKGNLTRLVPAVARELEKVEALHQQIESVEALKQTGDRLRLALDAGGMASWEWDSKLGWLAWSDRLEALFGLEPGEFGGSYEELLERVHPDDRELFGASVEEAIARNSPAVVYRTVWPDESVHWHERKSQQVVDADGQFRGVAGVTFDVTEREEAAATLRESEERFRLIAEHAHDLIALLDDDGRFSYVSPSSEPMLGYTPEELGGTLARDLIHPDDRPDGLIFRALREVRLERADGSWIWVEGRSYEIEGRSESHSAVIARDISERKRAEAARVLLETELRQAQKMEAIGQLAGGIAHDFSNLLTVISGYTEILLSRPAHEQPTGIKEILEIKRAAHRAARLIRQLLAFSRQQVIEPRTLYLTDIVRETQTMFAPLIGEHVEFETDLADDLGSVTADPGQIEQVIMNLVVNARDAMPDGGTLRVTTANVTLAEGDAADRGSDTPPGDYVVLSVTDSGHGMDADTAGRIFEPFFTTKERGAGTGLGLATVYGIAKQFGGDIEVESEPGVGTTFRLYFPRISAAPEPFRTQPVDDGRPLTGTETVLLVEDEEALRSIGKEILEAYGYTVILAGDGLEALALAHNGAEPIQLLMTDILMPKMGGIELAEQLSALHSDLKILYTSGYNDSGAGLRRVAGSRYLQKPYAMQQLGRTLRELLDPAAPQR
jgi:two-component system cell cycle sensor histidine kinase/response regulator CckA